MTRYPSNKDRTYRNIQKGDGKGSFNSYSPPIKRYSFSSNGCKCSSYGLTINRWYHFLSHLERDFFDIIDFKSSTIDIREQYPLLPLESTLLTAETLKIRHPFAYGHPTIMTSDFYIFYKKDDEIFQAVRQLKYSSELSDPRDLEKFTIEQRWWYEHGVDDWKIITEKQVDKKLARNIRELKNHRNLKHKEMFCNFSPDEIDRLRERLKSLILESDKPVGEIIERFDEQTGLKGGGIRIFKSLACNKEVPCNPKEDDFGIWNVRK